MWKYKIRYVDENGARVGWGDYINPRDPFSAEMLRRSGGDMKRAAWLHAFTPTIERAAFEECQIQIVAVEAEW